MLAAHLLLFLSLIHTTVVAEAVLSQMLASVRGVVLKSVHIGNQRLSLPGRLQFKDIKVFCEFNGTPLLLEAPRVEVTGLQSFLSADRRLLVEAEHVFAGYGVGELRDGKVALTVVREGISGPVTAVSLRWDKIEAANAAAFVIIKASDVELRAVELQAYGGEVSGKFQARSLPRAAAIYNGEFFIQDIDVAQLTEVNRDVASQLGGRVTGSLKWEGDAGAWQSFETDLTMPAGGQLSASLLAALTQYLPASREKKRLDVLIRKGGKLAMEVFSFTMKGGEGGRFAGEIRLRSREINLELNLEHEINTDGTIASLAAYWQKFLK